MDERKWSVKRAQAWVLRRAADEVLSGRHMDDVRLTHAMFSEPVDDEAGFRATLARVLGVADAEIDQAVAWVYAESDGRPDALTKAIRAITVEMPDDRPNGEAEMQLLRMEDILERLSRKTAGDERVNRHVRDACGAMAKLCEAWADDTRALRIAAEAFFGGDFSKPDAQAEEA